MTKSDLAARPIFHRKREAIEARLTVAFAALAVGKYVENKTELSRRQVVNTLRPMRSGVVQVGRAVTVLPPVLTLDAQRIVDKLDA